MLRCVNVANSKALLLNFAKLFFAQAPRVSIRFGLSLCGAALRGNGPHCVIHITENNQ
jgi:hypothetical protein